MHIPYKFSLVLLLLLLPACAAQTPPAALRISDIAMNLQQPAKNITTMAIARDGSTLVTVHHLLENNKPVKFSLHVWDLLQGRRQKTIAVHGLQSITSVDLSPDGKYALLGGQTSHGQSSLGIWDLDKGEQSTTFPDLKKDLDCVAFSPDGNSLLATHGNFVYLFNAGTGEFLKQFDTGHKGSIFRQAKRLKASFTPDGNYIITGGSDSVLKMWDIESGQKVQHFAGHEKGLISGISGLAVSSDSQFIFTSARGDGSVRKWDISTAQLQQKISANGGVQQGIWGTALSPDDKYGFIASQPPSLWDLTTATRVATLPLDNKVPAENSDGRQLAAFFHPHGKLFFLQTNDASVRLFDTSSGREVAMLVSFDDQEWLIMTAEGYYSGSEKGAHFLSAMLAGKNFPVERFYDAFYRPDIVMAALQGQDVRNLAPLTLSLAAKNPPPNVAFATLPNDTDEAKIKVCYQVSSSGGGIGEVRLFHNGKLLVSDGYYREMVKSPSEKMVLMAMSGAAIHEQMRSVAISGAGSPIPPSSHEKGEGFTDCKDIDTVPGNNEIAITAFNKDNTVQSQPHTLSFRSTKIAEPPHLYILALGSNKYKEKAINLKYAAKDAGDILQALGRQAATLYAPANIHQELMSNEKASKPKIMQKINELSAIIKPQDTFILFIAGHGILLQNQYYMLTSDYDGNLRDTNALSSNELVDFAKKIKSLKQLFILDACQAGGIDAIVSSLYEARMFILAKKMGVSLFASTNSVQEALDGYKGNGLFTHSLLEGLKNMPETDSNGDKSISFAELGKYAEQLTVSSAHKMGYRQTPLIINCATDTFLSILP